MLTLSCSYIVPREDYEHLRSTVDFTGSLFASITVQIDDDYRVEELREEYFFVGLVEYQGVSTSILSQGQYANITIIDDDGMPAHFYYFAMHNIYIFPISGDIWS